MSAPVSGAALKGVVGSERAEGAEVLLVALALNTRTRFWLFDVDAAIERAEEVQEETTPTSGRTMLDDA